MLIPFYRSRLVKTLFWWIFLQWSRIRQLKHLYWMWTQVLFHNSSQKRFLSNLSKCSKSNHRFRSHCSTNQHNPFSSLRQLLFSQHHNRQVSLFSANNNQHRQDLQYHRLSNQFKVLVSLNHSQDPFLVNQTSPNLCSVEQVFSSQVIKLKIPYLLNRPQW